MSKAKKGTPTFSNQSLPLPPRLDPILAESAHKPVTRCTFPLANPHPMPFSQWEKGISRLPSPLGRGAGVRDGGGRGEGSGDLLQQREEILEDATRGKVNLGVDLHAGEEAQLSALALEVAAAHID